MLAKSCVARATSRCSVRAPCRAPFGRAVASALPPRRMVQAHFFKFGKNGFDAQAAGIVGSQRRDEYIYDDVEQYFNYMGFLAEEGTYDRMEALLNSGLHPIDIILLLACSQGDTPKVQEILEAGADPTVKGLDGKTPLELATKPDLQAMLQAKLARV